MNVATIRHLPSTTPSWSRKTDVVVIGAGAAGLSAALEMSRSDHRVILLCKGKLSGGSTLHAQGGLAAVMGSADSLDSHVDDTLVAAAGLADETVVRQLVAAAPNAVRYLADLGARFDDGALGLEGGHSHRRIVHAGGDAIGAELHRVLREAVLSSNVEILEDTVAIDALHNVDGAVVGIVAGKIVSAQGQAEPLDTGVIEARAVVVATGGIGQAFYSSTNPSEVTGDGLALAARAGAELENVEFVQFHPTVLYIVGHSGQSPLITEAIRGAGATIVDDDDVPVMRGLHERGDLAPRDVVSFAMFQRMHSSGEPLAHLWLDARTIGASRLEKEFPTTLGLCRLAGVDPVSQLIPIAPGAHYACGGIRADLDGSTSVRGLFAIGEAASTGVHGANRLASNSLTESVISGRRLAHQMNTVLSSPTGSSPRASLVELRRARGVDATTRTALAAEMSAYAGVVRSRDGLEIVLETMSGTPNGTVKALDLATLEATNLHTVSLLVAYAASLREESRGCHRRSDFRAPSERWKRSITLQIIEDHVVAHVSTMVKA
jgi:L-aspartate oxidase